jgi:hypothetical protein
MPEIPNVIKGLLILVCVFIPIEKILSIHKQKIYREDWLTDICYYFSGSDLKRDKSKSEENENKMKIKP